MIDTPAVANEPSSSVNRTDPQREPERRLKVVFVTHSLDRVGGAEQVLFDLIDRLSDYSIDPVLCCLYELGEFGERLRDGGCQTYEHVAGKWFDPRNVFAIKGILKRENADILYVIDSFHDTVLGYCAAKLSVNVKTVMASHVFDESYNQAQGTGTFRQFMFSTADWLTNSNFDCVVALAESHKAYLAKSKQISEDKLSVVHNGIDHQRFLVSDSKTDTRKQFGLPIEKPIVGIVASLNLYKSHDVFLRVAARVKKEVPEAVFVVAGNGPERGNLEEMAKDLGLDEQVRFLGQVADIPRLLRSLDVSVLTSYHEAFPLALLESMAAELPVVASNVGSVDAIVGEGTTGNLVEFGDVDRFTKCVVDLLRDPEIAVRFGRAGRQRVCQKFTLDHMVRNTASAFFDLVPVDR